MPVRIDVSVRHTADELTRELSDMADRLDAVPAESMPEAVGLLAGEVAQEIESIAGGVYWDIDTEVNPTPEGAQGRVSTSKSAAHRIEPTQPHGILANPETGFFSKGGVDHPGSKPVDWVTPLAAGNHSAITGVFSEHARRAVGGGAAGGNLAMPVGGL